MKIFKRTLRASICLIFSTLIVSAASAQSNFTLETETGKVYAMMMENGFTVFVKEDPSSALIHAEFICKAGYTSQTPSSTGFFPLYTRLFSSTKNQDGSMPFSYTQLISSCNTDSSTYTADVTREMFPQFLKDISTCAISPNFSDSDISKKYEELKKECTDFAESPTGFINATMDSKIFAEAPWKQETGIYPALFSDYTVPEARTILTDIGRRFYVPDNSALFITGNITAAKAYNTALQYFGKWQGRFSGTESRMQDAFKKSSVSAQRKFVLIDPAFSEELTQIAVNFTSMDSTQTDILASAFTSATSPYKSAVLSEPILSIRSKDYAAASSVQRGSSSRLLLQALMEVPYSFAEKKSGDPENASPVDQAECFVKKIKEASVLSKKDFITAQGAVESRYRTQIGNSIKSMQMIADRWAFDSGLGDGNFYERFLTLSSSPKSTDEKSIAKKMQDEPPFVFVLLNPKVYAKYKKSFSDAGYEEVTREKGSWYHSEIFVAKALENERKLKEEKKNMELAGADIEELSPANRFYYSNYSQIQDTILENGIPMTVKYVPYSQSVTILMSVSGGEAASPKKEAMLRTVLINAYARNLQDEVNRMKAENAIFGDIGIKAETVQTVSYVTVECLKTDLYNTLTAMVNALVYGEITPLTADRLVSEQKGQVAQKLTSTDKQMEYNSLKYLFRDSGYTRYYDQEAEILGATNLHTISLSYTGLLDAALYSFVFVGDVKAEDAKTYGDLTFGLLREQTVRTPTYATVPEPEFKNKIRRVQLKHFYSSNLTWEEAGDEVPVLVPTKDFYDPVHYYFPAPKESHERNLYNSLLLELKERVQKYLPKDATCAISEATSLLHIGSVRCMGVLHTSDFLSAYQKGRNELLDKLMTDGESLVFSMKQKWISKNLLQTQTNSGTAVLIQHGIEENQPYQYLEDYVFMENANVNEYIRIFKNYLTETPALSVTSVDSKN